MRRIASLPPRQAMIAERAVTSRCNYCWKIITKYCHLSCWFSANVWDPNPGGIGGSSVSTLAPPAVICSICIFSTNLLIARPTPSIRASSTAPTTAFLAIALGPATKTSRAKQRGGGEELSFDWRCPRRASCIRTGTCSEQSARQAARSNRVPRVFHPSHVRQGAIKHRKQATPDTKISRQNRTAHPRSGQRPREPRVLRGVAVSFEEVPNAAAHRAEQESAAHVLKHPIGAGVLRKRTHAGLQSAAVSRGKRFRQGGSLSEEEYDSYM